MIYELIFVQNFVIMYNILKTEVLSLTALQQEKVQNTDSSTSSILDLHCIQVPVGHRIIQVPIGPQKSVHVK